MSFRFLFLYFLSFICLKLSAQDNVIETIVRARTMIQQIKPNEAYSQLMLIEKECMASDNDTLKAIYLGLKGQSLHDLERYEDCIPLCKEAIQLFERCNVRQYEYLDAFSNIATSYHRMKDYSNAEKYYRKGLLRSVAAKVSSSDQYRAGLYLNLGNLYEAKGDSLLAQECFNRSKQLQDAEPIDIDDLNYIEWENSYWDKIKALVDVERYEDAANLYSEFISGIKEKKGNKYKSYLLAVYIRAILLSRDLNKIDDAIPLFKELITISETLEESNDNICGAYCNLALCYSRKGDYNNVEKIITKGFPYLIKANSENYPPHTIYRFSGNGAYWQQDYSNAIKYYELYLNSSYEREKGSSYEEITNQLSVSYIFSNQPNKAKTILSNLLKSDETRLKTENPSLLATVYHNLGRAIMLEGSKNEALEYLTKSKDLQMNIYGEVAERTLIYIQECQK